MLAWILVLFLRQGKRESRARTQGAQGCKRRHLQCVYWKAQKGVQRGIDDCYKIGRYPLDLFAVLAKYNCWRRWKTLKQKHCGGYTIRFQARSQISVIDKSRNSISSWCSSILLLVNVLFLALASPNSGGQRESADEQTYGRRTKEWRGANRIGIGWGGEEGLDCGCVSVTIFQFFMSFGRLGIAILRRFRINRC